MGKGLETLPTGDKRELGSLALLSDPHQAALHASSNALGKNEDIQELDFSSERHGPSMEPAVFKVRSVDPCGSLRPFQGPTGSNYYFHNNMKTQFAWYKSNDGM